MLAIVLEGLLFGLGLAVSLGPIFIALTQTSMERGIMPGMTVGLGIWVSDILIVALFYKFIYELSDNVESASFKFWLGISGALLLVGFGLYLILKKPILEFEKIELSLKNYFGFFSKGFLINTVNPFTFFFWMSVISTYVIGRDLTIEEHIVFLTTILTVIVVSDMGKVFLADFLKNWLTPKHIDWISNLSGVILLGFGIFLGVRVI